MTQDMDMEKWLAERNEREGAHLEALINEALAPHLERIRKMPPEQQPEATARLFARIEGRPFRPENIRRICPETGELLPLPLSPVPLEWP